MNGENNFGNNNGNQFNGLNGNPNEMNNVNQGMQGNMQPTPDLNNGNNMNQGMQPNMDMQQAPTVQPNMQMNNGFNQPNGTVPNNGMNPGMNNMQMPMNNGVGSPQPPVPAKKNNKNTMVGIIVCVGALIFVVVLVFVVANLVGGKKLTCEMTEDIGDIEMKIVDEIKYKKKGDSKEKASLIFTNDDGFTDDEYEKIEDSFGSYFEDTDEDFVVKPKISRKGKSIVITATTKENYEDRTFAELKEDMEDAGYTCK